MKLWVSTSGQACLVILKCVRRRDGVNKKPLSAQDSLESLNVSERTEEKWMQMRRRSRSTSQAWASAQWRRMHGEGTDGWKDAWRDDGGRLNGSTWQLIERGSRVATLCNLLAGPWCMQPWYRQDWQTHAGNDRAVRRDKLVFSKTQVQKREEAVCFHPLLSRPD